MTSRTPTRTRNGTPSDVTCAITPPATEPPSIAAPPTIWPRPNTASSSPTKPECVSASTSHASTAPEKNVKPRPIRIETSAHAQNAAEVCHMK
jgi:hypothetical protein